MKKEVCIKCYNKHYKHMPWNNVDDYQWDTNKRVWCVKVLHFNNTFNSINEIPKECIYKEEHNESN